ncbi:MAG: CapA family protein [Actinobacteria bacterium]|nr:CapA family protein [Actinomycetota bacterium]
MRRFVFIRLVCVLTCFVAGGLLAGVAVAGAKINVVQQSAEAFENHIGETIPQSLEAAPQIIVSLVGDVLLASGVGSAIAASGPDYPWLDTARLLRHSDIAIANLECSVSERGNPVPEKKYTFRAAPDSINGAVNAGVDVFTLANNHVMDYGADAFMDTLRVIKEKGLSYAGAGVNEAEAFRPVLLERNGFKIAVLAFTKVVPRTDWIAGKNRPGIASGYSRKLMMESIRSAAEKGDIIIVCMHWGQETADYPSREEIALAHSLIDAGADVVVGHHPHVIQGLELYKNKLIAYSLGNFIFTSSSQKAREGSILQIIFDSGGGYTARIIPTFIASGTTTVLRGDDRKRVLSRVNGLSAGFGTSVQENGTISPKRESGGQ